MVRVAFCHCCWFVVFCCVFFFFGLYFFFAYWFLQLLLKTCNNNKRPKVNFWQIGKSNARGRSAVCCSSSFSEGSNADVSWEVARPSFIIIIYIFSLVFWSRIHCLWSSHTLILSPIESWCLWGPKWNSMDQQQGQNETPRPVDVFLPQRGRSHKATTVLWATGEASLNPSGSGRK